MEYNKKNVGIIPTEQLKPVLVPTGSVISKFKEINCTGCGTCANICPANALTMEANNEGFFVPKIDYEKCINCGLCEKKCVALHPQYNNNKAPECYAFLASDEIREVSSSGGVFTVAAEYVLSKGGTVIGAVYDADFHVKHVAIADRNELWRVRGSKYIQSNTGAIYKTAKYSLQGTTQGRYLTGGVPPVRFSM